MVLNLNARSIVNKFPDLLALLSVYSPDIVGITETWLHDGIFDSEFTPPGYIAVRTDRQIGKGGGVALLLRQSLKFSVLPSPSDIESAWCKLHLHKQSVVIGLFYRPPGSPIDTLHNLSHFMLSHNLQHGNLLLMGDFNVPGIDWSSLNYSGSDTAIGCELITQSLSLDLTQIVHSPTRLTAILDLVFVNSRLMQYVTCDIIDGISDHKGVLVSIPCSLPKPRTVYTTFHDFNRADDTSIIDTLAGNFDTFSNLNLDGDVNILVKNFESVIQDCINRFVPLKTKKINPNIPWMNRDILHASRKVNRLRRKKTSTNGQNIDCFLKAKELLHAKIKSAQDFYFRFQLQGLLKTNPRKFWQTVSPTNTTPTSFVSGGQIISDTKEISHAFNTYFNSVFTDDNSVIPPFSNAPCYSPITDVSVSEQGILNLILNLDTKKGAGPDNIPNAFLVRYSLWTSRYLSIIFQKSLSTATVPLAWKHAKVLPFFKAGDRQLFSNYRPISITSHSCKLIEHIIFKHIMEYLESNSILSKVQHGFRRGFSTVTQLVEFTHDISRSMDSGSQIDAIFIDLSKAFDTVIHSKLLCKLNAILKNPSLVQWISNFLSERTQSVCFNSAESSIMDVSSGVPQGSVLGPLLFLLYINDLPSNINSSIRLYADDCVLYQVINSQNDHQVLNESFANFCSWCSKWQMKINFNKTVILTFSTSISSSQFCYSFNNCTLSRVNNYKYLGVIFDNKLSWAKHIDYITAKALKKLGYLRRVLAKAPKDTKLIMYKSLIRPIIEYASPVWNPHKQLEINKIESVQRKAIRFICRRYDRHFSPTSALLSLNLTLLAERRRIESLKLLHSAVHSPYSDTHFTFSRPLSTRSHHYLNLTPIFARTDIFKHSFFPRTIEWWNALPGSVRALPQQQFLTVV